MHNLGTVFRFELTRTLKKKSFWISALSFPVVIAAVFAIIFFSNKTTNEAADNMKNQQFSIAITDQSGHVSPEILSSLKAKTVADKQQAIDEVKSGKLDAYYYYPQDLTKNRVEVYAKDVGLFNNGKYESVAKTLLQTTASAKVDPQTTLVLQDKVNFSSLTYKDGEQFDGIKELIAPGIFLVLFYILIAMFGSQMLTSTTEEKENRVIEMILTTIEARTLIIGKIFSLIILALIQVIVILIPVIIVYLLFRTQLELPNVDLSSIPIDPLRIGVSALIFVFSFLLFTGLLVGIGAAAPTAKEAGSFFGVIMVFIFGPLYAFTLFVSMPESPLVKFLSFFPLTAPIPLLLRNAVGNLSLLEAAIGIAILAVSSVIALSIAVRLFRYGALEYSKRLSLDVLFKKKS
ncbi:ABC transporter permease [Candidatus Saccharibacteria bacterium]|nr:ABC transporter permease [Candidatus Saccharibacteria bacterium]